MLSDLLDRALNEPVILLVFAGAAVALGIDLDQLSDAVNKIIDLAVLAGAAGLARQQVKPMRKLPDGDDS